MSEPTARLFPESSTPSVGVGLDEACDCEFDFGSFMIHLPTVGNIMTLSMNHVERARSSAELLHVSQIAGQLAELVGARPDAILAAAGLIVRSCWRSCRWNASSREACDDGVSRKASWSSPAVIGNLDLIRARVADSRLKRLADNTVHGRNKIAHHQSAIWRQGSMS
jgi:hypothetical protein